ncbi:titin-like isoform X2 [Cylas formicarius]|uniref:titin-like isoform X2 n=1 Tax=Cylas formicarius TaxID=197179 RepID=UPI002958ABE3|nr:titin-like isoform X2 [Cylas formicarius]
MNRLQLVFTCGLIRCLKIMPFGLDRIVFWSVLTSVIFVWCGNATRRLKSEVKSERHVRSYAVRSRDYSPGNSLKASSRGTGFLTSNYSVVVAQVGGTAKLPCVVSKINNGVVSWIRKNDSTPTILTVGLGVYIADDRFFLEHTRHLQNWGLVIKHVRPTDAGLYECQMSTHPAASIFMELKVTEAVAEITGAPELHIRAGSRLRIVCRLRDSTEPPNYIFWYHEDRMINHDPEVYVSSDSTSSVLSINDVDPSFSGNYTCLPSNAIAAYVNVHVLNNTEGNFY